MPRLYREAPLNGIWEGTGNLVCLDVLRAMQKEPDTVAALLAELGEARGADERLATAIYALATELSALSDHAPRARYLSALLATPFDAAPPVTHSTPPVSPPYVLRPLHSRRRRRLRPRRNMAPLR